MPVYNLNYRGAKIKLAHNLRDMTYTLSILKIKERRELSFSVEQRGEIRYNQGSNIIYFTERSRLIRSIIPLFGMSDMERRTVIRALDSLIPVKTE